MLIQIIYYYLCESYNFYQLIDKYNSGSNCVRIRKKNTIIVIIKNSITNRYNVRILLANQLHTYIYKEGNNFVETCNYFFHFFMLLSIAACRKFVLFDVLVRFSSGPLCKSNFNTEPKSYSQQNAAHAQSQLNLSTLQCAC